MTASLLPDTRDCRLYRFHGWDPYTGYTTKRLVYLGETARQPIDRLMEHVRSQPWSDTITSFDVDDRVFPGKAAVLAAEQAAVEAERPLYNYEWNSGNPDRVPIPVARRQRWARDHTDNRPRWVPPSGQQPSRRPAFRRRAVQSRRGANRWPAVLSAWAGSWALLAAMSWNILDSESVSPATRGWGTCVAPLVALGWGTMFGPAVWRRWRRGRFW